MSTKHVTIEFFYTYDDFDLIKSKLFPVLKVFSQLLHLTHAVLAKISLHLEETETLYGF